MENKIQDLLWSRLSLVQHEDAPCPHCGQTVQWFSIGNTPAKPDCPPCHAAEKERRRLTERREQCLARWMDITPPEMQQRLIPSLLAPELRDALALDGTHGVGFAGPGNAGKTRVAYHLLKKAANRGLWPYAVTDAALREAANLKTAFEPATRNAAASVIKQAHTADVLLIDDIGKAACTERGNAALFELINERHAERKRTIWTTNASSDYLREQFGPDRGPPLLRRMMELAGKTQHGPGYIFTIEAA